MPENNLEEVFRDKPRRILPPPEGPQRELLTALAAEPETAVVELAGRDSVAAGLKAARDLGFKHLVPTYVYTGSEHGDWGTVPAAWRALSQAAPAGTTVYPLLLLGWPRLWQALCGRFLGGLTRRLGLSPVCPGCHLYLHVMRAPLARMLGNAAVVAGERESHDGRRKLNQVGPALDAYTRAMADLGMELLLPLRHVDRGEEVAAMVGDDWPEGGRQLACVLSGNYLDPAGGLEFDPQALEAYFTRFALPLAVRAVGGAMDGEPGLDPVSLGAELLAAWPE